MNQTLSSTLAKLLADAAQHAEKIGVFEDVELRDGMLWALAKDTPSPVHYRIEPEGDSAFVSWNTPDRYLSQSIETDLIWTGDDLDDLIDEELVDLGWNHGKLEPLKHFRNDEMFFTFRSRLPKPLSAFAPADLACCLHGYELAFRELGDMAGDDEDQA